MYRQFDPVVGDDAVTKRLLDRHRKAGRGREPYFRFVQELEAAPAYRAQQLVGGGGGGDPNAPVDAPPGFWNNYEGMTDADFQDFNATQAARAVSMGRDFGNVPLSAQNPPPPTEGPTHAPAYWNGYAGATPAFFSNFNEQQAARAVSMGRDYGNVPLSAQNPPPPTAGQAFAPASWNGYAGATPAFFSDFNELQAARAVSMGRDYGNVPLSAQDPPPQVGDRMARKAKRVEERSDVSGGQALADALADPAGGDVSNVVGSMLEAKEDESDTKRPRSALPYAIDGFARARQQELVPNVAPRAGPSRDDIARERQQFRNVLAVEDEVVQAGFRGPIPASQQRGVDDLDEAHARHQL